MQYTLNSYSTLGETMTGTKLSIAEALEKVEVSPCALSLRAKNGGPTTFKISNVKSLDGVYKQIITEVGDGAIIKMFDKTPFPEKDDDVVCPHFMEFKWANGCNFDCAWCYLNGTMRFRPMGKSPYLKEPKKIVSHLTEYLNAESNPTLLNSGELSDSLVYEGTKFSLTKDIIPIIKKQRKHKLLILTKSTNISGILNSNSKNHVIISFSVNALPVSKLWEVKAPSPIARIKAAKKLSDAGYKIRFRIDPMVAIDGWKEKYSQLVDLIYSQVSPERITLGSLRGLQSTINFCKDISWTKYLDDRSNWGLKASFETRLSMYLYIIEKLKEYDSRCVVGICKETMKMWDELGMKYGKIKCNCIE